MGAFVQLAVERPSSPGLSAKIRSVLEEGPPEELVANFRKLFSAKKEDTKAEAIRAAKHYGLLPELV